jgi:hypothetical protein
MREPPRAVHPDLLREMRSAFVHELMGAEAQPRYDAEYREGSSERWSPVASPVFACPSLTTTLVSSRRSRPCCRELAGNGVAFTSSTLR